MPRTPDRPVQLCGDGRLGYAESRTVFEDGRALRLDETYRFAHLPLVAPAHPDAILSEPVRGYHRGRHASVFSLVLPVSDELLEGSPAYRELRHDLQGAAFARKIDWTLADRRRGKLHATVCGGLGVDRPPAFSPAMRHGLARLGPIAVELRGLFSGNRNVGRLYLRVYPECRDDDNLLAAVQRCLGRPETGIFLVGLHNLVDHLAPHETTALAALLDAWWDRPLLRFEARSLSLLRASDDLALESATVETFALC